MIINGQIIADRIYAELQEQVSMLLKKGITPRLVVVLVGDNPTSLSYIKQKTKATAHIGATLTLIHLPNTTTQEEVINTIAIYNQDPTVHAILVQKPLPSHIDGKQIDRSIAPEKDIDGFHPASAFTLALALAVEEILKYVFSRIFKKVTSEESFIHWLQLQKVVVLGKGETAGTPTITYLRTLGVSPTVIDRKTINKDEILKQADIIISAVGKGQILQRQDLKQGVILIGVGIHRGDDGKLHGDYDEEEVENIASFYTPTPGGVGPVNVACLMKNLVHAAQA